jgi:uncharacterized lipoprotein YmbA
MGITGVSNANTHALQIQQAKQAKQPQKTQKTEDQSQQIRVNDQLKAQEVVKKQEATKVAKVEKQDNAQKAETQAHNVAKQKDVNAQLLKRMEAQAAMHPAFLQVQQQHNATKVEATKEASKVAATNNTNTAKR